MAKVKVKAQHHSRYRQRLKRRTELAKQHKDGFITDGKGKRIPKPIMCLQD